MSNPNNNITLVGRLSQDKKVFKNADGSHNVLLTLAVENNFQSKNPDTKKVETLTNFIPLRAYVPASVNGLGSWDRVGKGDLISLNARLAAVPYTKDGQVQYPLSVEVDGWPQFLESKAVTDARAAKRAVEAAGADSADEGKSAREIELERQLAEARGESAVSTEPFQG